MSGSTDEAQSESLSARTPITAHLWALLGYLALALVVTYPAITQFTSQVPGDLIADRDQNLWNLWWVREALARPTNPFHTDMLYYPFGVDLYYHTLGLPLGLIGLVPQVLLGLPAAYNTVLLVAFTLSGYGAFRLALLFVGGVGAWRAMPLLGSFLGGIVFAFTPYTLDALKGQTEVLSLQWMPLYAEAWIRASRGQGARWAMWAGTCLALAAYTSLYYAAYLLLFTGAHLVWGRVFRSARALRAIGVVAGVAFVLALPLLGGLVANYNNPRFAVEADPGHRLAHSADLLSFFAPPHDHPLLGNRVERPGVEEPPIHDYLSLGYVALGLAVLGGVTGLKREGTRFWVMLGAVALVLAMGPQLQVGRNLTGIPLPFALVEILPGFDSIAKPERFVVLARLCMGVLAAWGAIWVINKLAVPSQTQMRRALPYAALLALLLVELPIHPRYVEPFQIPQGYRQFAGREEDGGLMELPFATQQAETIGERMLYQTVHGRPIMAGYLARTYSSPIIDSCSPFWGFISPLDVPKEGEEVAAPLVVSRPLDVLNFYNIRHIALYSTYGRPDERPLDEEQRAAYLDIISSVSHTSPVFRDDYVSVYEADKVGLENATPSFHIGQGWYDVEEVEGEPFRWMRGGRGTICVFAPYPIRASLVLEGTAFAQDREIDVVFSDQFDSGQFHSGTLGAGGVFTRMDVSERVFRLGITEVYITARGTGITPLSLDPNSQDDRPLTVGIRNVRLEVKE